MLGTSVKEKQYYKVAKFLCQINKPLMIIQNKACVGPWTSTNLPWICNRFLWIHQSLSPPSLPWFINPHGISTARNMKSKLVIKFPTPYEWWSNALSPGGLSSSNSLPPEQEKESNAWGMPGRGMLKLQFDWYSMYIRLEKIMQYVFCPSLVQRSQKNLAMITSASFYMV